MKKYMITLNDKVYEVEIEEVTKSTGEEEKIIIQNSSLTKLDNNAKTKEMYLNG